MGEGKVPPDLFSLSDSDTEGGDGAASQTGDDFVLASGGRLGASSGAVDLAAAVPDEDEAVEQVAERFRRGKLANLSISAPSLDSQAEVGESTVSSDELQSFVLDALDSDEDAAPAASVVSAGAIPADPKGVMCPSCSGVNPPGMSFCVQCGGSLSSSAPAAAAPAKPAAPKEPPPPSALARQENPWAIALVSINEDGSDGVEIPLEYLETTIGRDGDTRFPTDAFLSPRHARLHIDKGALAIEDLYSLNGTFLKLRDEVRLAPGDTFLMGRQVLRFERFEQAITPKTKSSDGTRYMGSPSPGGSFKVLQIGIGGVVQNVYCLPDSGAVLGREKGDIIFPHDKFMSSRHAQIYTGDDGHCYLVDLNSSNGTWIKIWERTKLQDFDFIFMGQQLFRVSVEGKR